MSSEITVEVILCKYSRRLLRLSEWAHHSNAADIYVLSFEQSKHWRCSLECVGVRWAEAPVKIARMTLTAKLDGNWSSFQLANNTPPLSVTGSVIAPSARMRYGGKEIVRKNKHKKATFKDHPICEHILSLNEFNLTRSHIRVYSYIYIGTRIICIPSN